MINLRMPLDTVDSDAPAQNLSCGSCVLVSGPSGSVLVSIVDSKGAGETK